MNLILYDIKQLTATETIACDATQFFKQYYWSLPDIKVRMNFICDFFKIRNEEIKQNQHYDNITLIDQDTGEQLEMNVTTIAHQLCISRGVYPFYLNRLFV